MIVPALAFSVLGTLVAYWLPSDILRRSFGVFLMILSVFQFRHAFADENS